MNMSDPPANSDPTAHSNCEILLEDLKKKEYHLIVVIIVHKC